MKNYEVKYGPTGMIICINQLYINIYYYYYLFV